MRDAVRAERAGEGAGTYIYAWGSVWYGCVLCVATDVLEYVSYRLRKVVCVRTHLVVPKCLFPHEKLYSLPHMVSITQLGSHLEKLLELLLLVVPHPQLTPRNSPAIHTNETNQLCHSWY